MPRTHTSVGRATAQASHSVRDQGLQDTVQRMLDEEIRMIRDSCPGVDVDFLYHKMSQQKFVEFGRKPDKGEPVWLVQVPPDPIAIRFFPDQTNPAIWFFDFYDVRYETPVNAPRGYAVSIVSPKALHVSGEIRSLEAALAPGTELLQGSERFVVMESVICELERPGQARFQFRVPARKIPGVMEAVLSS